MVRTHGGLSGKTGSLAFEVRLLVARMFQPRPQDELPHGSVIWTPSRVVLVFALTLLPPILAAAMIARFGVDIPFFDDWMFTKTIHEFLDGKPLWDVLMFPHNEHRMPVPRALQLCIVFLTDWNVLAVLAFDLILAVGSLVTLTWLVPRTLGPGQVPWWLLPCIAVLLFSLVGWELWLWSWTMANHLALLLSLLALVSITMGTLSIGRVLLAAAVSFLACFTFASSWMLWPLGMLAVAVREQEFAPWRSPRQWIWFLAAAFCALVYFWDGSVDIVGKGEGVRDWSQLFPYTALALGNVITGPDPARALPWGIAGLGVFGFLLLRVFYSPASIQRRALPWILIGLLGLGTMALAWWGRGIEHVNQAMSPRYVNFASLPWISILALLALLLAQVQKPQERRWMTPILTLAALILTGVSLQAAIRSIDSMALHSARLTDCRNRLLRGQELSPEQKDFLYNMPTWHEENVELLRPLGLSLYRSLPLPVLFPPQERFASKPDLVITASSSEEVRLEMRGLRAGDLYCIGIIDVDGIPTWFPIHTARSESAEPRRIDVPIPPVARGAQIEFRAWWLRGDYLDLTPSRIRPGAPR